MKNHAYCVDVDKMLITKFDCACAPSGIKRWEFATETENRDEILKEASRAAGESVTAFCEHF